ncbi:MAG: SMC-Scp complex subunit ScpB [Candidatus Omnitrophica bacterium]|nr:SMC-Scp complex subunit ScpB [Candidatus Omnitrophota bacterium]
MEENTPVPIEQQQAFEPAPAARHDDNVKAVIEALLFSSDKPLLPDQLRRALDNLDINQVRAKVEELKNEYEHTNRGFRIYEVAGGYQMIAATHFSTFLRKLYKGGQSHERLSRPALETLAIIAYKQPLSKMEIETLRKVNVDGVMETLQEKNLIRVTGRKKAPGRPKVYGTTRQFLEYFGLKSLEELPKIENFPLSEKEQAALIETIGREAESPTPSDNEKEPDKPS